MKEISPAVDSHHHLWDAIAHRYPYLTDGSRDDMHGKPLPRRYLIGSYLRDIKGLGITKSVHVQCGWDPDDPAGETRWLETVALSSGFPHGIVAHADLASPTLEETLEAHCRASSRMRGIRQHVGWHVNPRYRLAARGDMLDDPAWQRGYARLARYRLSFDLQAFFPQFEAAARLAEKHPDIPMILNNAGTPIDREPDAVSAWRDGLRRLASVPHICVKLGGFGMIDHKWTENTIRPMVDDLIEIFGVDRCMFSSNFPVDGLFRDFRAMWMDYHSLVAHVRADERGRLFHDNAAAVYRLNEA